MDINILKKANELQDVIEQCKNFIKDVKQRDPSTIEGDVKAEHRSDLYAVSFIKQFFNKQFNSQVSYEIKLSNGRTLVVKECTWLMLSNADNSTALIKSLTKLQHDKEIELNDLH